ncbi:hypothetical protein EMIHUDRAFT_452346 [Emiliania huxleyi CCMP1516]|uniref:Toprim domain-containing protein n=2 Tax=Emiliania huxleyi TaxID=2903 RepID=A0A0D3IKY3_EMIH1|nr:hypothetical protein EMIHUDRAFT_452346 [Emiliania huxleyi CCMP1516]EOD11918.1 hypothetical protein EMIHUDRAFT_452346 [Emiliania huxleyi CCMP1516]|eukprot:XP_005764347.1 hypothetical protein EMIHUDRAFT_452346 [Emiliania huxleyi CCMP1516]
MTPLLVLGRARLSFLLRQPFGFTSAIPYGAAGGYRTLRRMGWRVETTPHFFTGGIRFSLRMLEPPARASWAVAERAWVAEAAVLSEVIASTGLELIPSGPTFKARCPFHKGGEERTPSLSIDDRTGYWKCFSCQEGGDADGSLFDRFAGRLVIPISSSSGDVVGFGARLSDVFKKSELLYALPVARSAARRADAVVLVEGYMDAIALHAAGVENVVACLGTAISEAQLEMAARLSPSRVVLLSLDADEAGRAAVRRLAQRGTLQRLDARGATTRVASLPAGCKAPRRGAVSELASLLASIPPGARRLLHTRTFSLTLAGGDRRFAERIEALLEGWPAAHDGAPGVCAAAASRDASAAALAEHVSPPHSFERRARARAEVLALYALLAEPSLREPDGGGGGEGRDADGPPTAADPALLETWPELAVLRDPSQRLADTATAWAAGEEGAASCSDDGADGAGALSADADALVRNAAAFGLEAPAQPSTADCDCCDWPGAGVEGPEVVGS